MELATGLIYGALPMVLLGASAGLAFAYNKLVGRNSVSERDRESYLEILEGSNDALFVINFVNGRIYQANQQAAKLLGYSREKLAKLSIFDLHPPHMLQLSSLRIADAWERKGLIYEDLPLLTSKGDLVQVECSTKVISYQGVPAIILFARDIRARLALQRAIEEQQAVVSEQNRELLSSIRYAQRIQRAVLPEAEQLQEFFPESFILFRPRDIVSGDLYWFAENKGRVVVAAADCTGHGVPGALLSLIAASLFQESVVERGITEPGLILDAAREGMVHALNKQDGSADRRDGMNASVVSLDRARMELRYAGAFSPLYLIRRGELIEHKGDRMPIGFADGEMGPFSTVTISLEAGDRIFLFSDGIQDQFGGQHGKKLKSAGLKAWLLTTATLPMDEQYQAVSDLFRMWKGDAEQIDDVLLIGLQV
ncbi:MAG: SpoIIE family protein phosphatase [Flavobacteriales bacterium]